MFGGGQGAQEHWFCSSFVLFTIPPTKKEAIVPGCVSIPLNIRTPIHTRFHSTIHLTNSTTSGLASSDLVLACDLNISYSPYFPSGISVLILQSYNQRNWQLRTSNHPQNTIDLLRYKNIVRQQYNIQFSS